MATYTTALNLKKPAGGENVLIGDINGNMDTLDAEDIKIRANFAGAYSASSEYAVGDYCTHDGNLFRCTTAIGSGGETWTAGHWTQVAVGDELSTINDNIGNVGSTDLQTQINNIVEYTNYPGGGTKTFTGCKDGTIFYIRKTSNSEAFIGVKVSNDFSKIIGTDTGLTISVSGDTITITSSGAFFGGVIRKA